MEVCFGIKMILKRAKFTKGQHFGKVSQTCWLWGPEELLISSRGASLPALSSRSVATESPPRSILRGAWQGVAVSGFLACLLQLSPILRAPLDFVLFLNR